MRKYILILLTIFLYFPAQATELTGSEITYTNVGQDSFMVKIIAYKSCRSYAVDSINLCIQGIGFNYSDTQVLYTKFCKNITPVCETSCSKCDNNNCNANGYPNGSNSTCGFPYGFEQLIFEKLVILPKDTNGKMCEFRFSISECCRFSQTTTCCAGEKHYNYTHLDRCLTPNNSSPEFTCEPVFLLASGNCTSICFSATDKDGDSVSYKLEPALTGFNSRVTYNGNYGSTKPLLFKNFPMVKPFPSQPCSGFMIDSIDGWLNFMPTQQQRATLVFVAKEWRKINGKMKQIGVIRRDYQVTVIANVKSKPPTLIGPFNYIACAGDKINWSTITSNDPDTGDTVRLTYHSDIKNAQYKLYFDSASKHQSMDWEWQTSINDVSTNAHRFIVEAQDNSCPFIQRSCRVYAISVKECPSDVRKYEDLGCGRIKVSAIPDSIYNNGSTTYEWRYNGQSYKAQDTFIQMQRGSPAYIYHEFRHNNYSQDYVDMVSFKDWIMLNLSSDTNYCPGSLFSVKAQTKNAKGIVQYSWNRDSLTAKDSMNYIVFSTKKIEAMAIDSAGCIDSTSISINPLPSPQIDIGRDTTICAENQFKLENRFNQLNYRNTWSNGDTARSIYTDTNQIYFLTVTDSNLCKQTDSIVVLRHAKPNPSFQISQSNLNVILHPDSVNYLSYLWNLGDGYTTDSIEPMHTYSYSGNYQIKLYIVDRNGCFGADSQSIDFYNGFNKYKYAYEIKVSPNPNNGDFDLLYHLNQVAKVSISIYDACGTLIHQGNRKVQPSGDQTETIKLNNVSNGIYLLKLNINEDETLIRIVVNK